MIKVVLALLKDSGKKCFGFTKMDAGEIGRIKKAAFGVGAHLYNSPSRLLLKGNNLFETTFFWRTGELARAYFSSQNRRETLR